MSYFNQIQTLQYMGSKSRMLDSICTPILNDSAIKTVVDLFAGTGSVGYALKEFKYIISNDLEPYAYVLNSSILNGCIFTEAQQDDFFKRVSYYFKLSSDKLNQELTLEESFFNANEDTFLEYAEFVNSTPSVFGYETDKKYYSKLKELVKKVIPGQKIQEVPFPCLFITYYANTYFGLKQCCQIDAICAAIMEISDERQKNYIRTALMSVMSVFASTTTHFAQFLKVNSASTFRNLIQKRSRDIVSELHKVLGTYRKIGLPNKKESQAECFNLDYYDCLNKINLNDSVLVYADPPYFKEHYSRYYHVLNTMCLYDYPHLAINPQRKVYSVGRYRDDRNVSDFGKKAAVLKAFEKLIVKCSSGNAKLIISYSDNSIVNIDALAKLVGKYYLYQIVKVELNHSKQGRTSESDSKVDEYLFMCMKPTKSDINIQNAIARLSDMKPIVDNPGGFLHNYMARKPYNVVAALIECFSKPGDTIYDPMFGSGTTIIEASKASRQAVGTDINPVAHRLCRVSLKAWDMDLLQKTLSDFLTYVEEECSDIYKYESSDGQQIIERCHFDCINGKLVPTKYWYKFFDGKKMSGRKSAIATEDFIDQYYKYEKYTMDILNNHVLIPNSRIAIKEEATIFDYFCLRNRYALDKIMAILKKLKHGNVYGYDVIELIVSSAINLIKLSDKKASSQMPYWLPKKDATSRNAVFIIQKKVKAVFEGLCFLHETCRVKLSEDTEGDENSIRIFNKAAQKLSKEELPENSIDLVLTDPPYTDQVPYLEYSQLWNNILGYDDIINLDEELVVSDAPSRKKDSENFYLLYDEIVKRTSMSLKDGGYYIMFYHSFDLQSWSRIITLMKNEGLCYCEQIPTAAPRKSFKTVMSPKSTLDGNYVLIFQKMQSASNSIFNGDIKEAITLSISCADEIIRKQKNVTSQDLYDCGMLKDAIEKGYLECLSKKYATFVDVIKSHFLFENGYWRLK